MFIVQSITKAEGLRQKRRHWQVCLHITLQILLVLYKYVCCKKSRDRIL